MQLNFLSFPSSPSNSVFHLCFLGPCFLRPFILYPWSSYGIGSFFLIPDWFSSSLCIGYFFGGLSFPVSICPPLFPPVSCEIMFIIMHLLRILFVFFPCRFSCARIWHVWFHILFRSLVPFRLLKRSLHFCACGNFWVSSFYMFPPRVKGLFSFPFVQVGFFSHRAAIVAPFPATCSLLVLLLVPGSLPFSLFS